MYLGASDMVKVPMNGRRAIVFGYSRDASGQIVRDSDSRPLYDIGQDTGSKVMEGFYPEEALKRMRRCSNCGGYGHKRNTCDHSYHGPVSTNALETDRRLREWFCAKQATVNIPPPPPVSQPVQTTHAAPEIPKPKDRYKCWKSAETFLALAHEKMKNCWLEGPPATGKTSAGNFIGFGNDTPGCYSITMHNDMSVEELIGHFVPSETGQGFDKYEGPAVRAIKEGKRLVFNELDRASDSVMSVLHNLLDDTDISVVRFLDQEIRPGKGYHVVGTSNETLQSLDFALQSRFTYKVVIDVPHPDAIEKLPEDLREPCLNSYALADSQPELLVTYRQWRDFAETREVVDDVEMAAEGIFGERWTTILDGLNLRNGGNNVS